MVDGRRGDGPPDGWPAIELSGLTKRYRRGKGWFTAVNDVTLTVPQGQVIGLLGPNGAGKTTTIKMACGLIIPTTGTIRLNGYDVGRRRADAVRQIGAVLEIACHGRVFVDMRGVRAEYAGLVRIALPGAGWPGEAAPGEPSRMLRDRYGVPVGGAECVPRWLTANMRPGGAPPDGESLNLELARLDLSCQEGPKLNLGELERR